ncbi:hypothetical protein [Lactococcus lactis]|uniref:hypothetical protein n=1 Tax=Lactococcus lactis TaxID=1358 RepID=UPI000512BBBC|nr:hypothetical protein [Lactococcus lactis]KGF77143.1 hypothetical protein Llab_0866 [Lactococcus lactis]MDT2885582.1 hypothetical protein [Lactococcus lactis]MDT2904788.1 hypothetical protein [Lactococcus lactis]MDT2910563.1 hypothetical protein [Lactococcus lactis]MDT2929322.1 hypothetical protein [Lactococcus lactis]
MSRVDRSYSKYESIRTYEDRGKMKWNPFATAELASAHRDYRSEFSFEEPDFSLEQDDKMTMLSFAKSLQLEITIEYHTEKENKKVTGIVLDWKDKTGIIFKKQDGHYQEIELDLIVKLTDKEFFDPYLKQ